MADTWTCSDLGSAIKSSAARIKAERHPASAEEALLTMAKLLTGAGGPIPDAEVRRLEAWLVRP